MAIRTFCGCLLLALAGLPGWSSGPANSPLTLPQYVAELQRVSAALEDTRHPEQAAELARSIPEAWSVEANGASFSVSTSELKGEIALGTPASWQRAHRRLALMREEASGFDQSRFDSATERSVLNGILARREFSQVRGPNWMDRLRQRAVEIIVRMLERLFGSSAFPTVTRIVVWVLVGAAVAVLAVMAFRLIRRGARWDSVVPSMAPVKFKDSRAWLAEARAAAERGDWREAIHRAYWAAISFLELQGLWRPDRARTPREYLRLLPASSPHHPALAALTRRFEVVWYGYQAAGEEFFRQSMADLENLGCL
jgi:hypothetical protein